MKTTITSNFQVSINYNPSNSIPADVKEALDTDAEPPEMDPEEGKVVSDVTDTEDIPDLDNICYAVDEDAKEDSEARDVADFEPLEGNVSGYGNYGRPPDLASPSTSPTTSPPSVATFLPSTVNSVPSASLDSPTTTVPSSLSTSTAKPSKLPSHLKKDSLMSSSKTSSGGSSLMGQGFCKEQADSVTGKGDFNFATAATLAMLLVVNILSFAISYYAGVEDVPYKTKASLTLSAGEHTTAMPVTGDTVEFHDLGHTLHGAPDLVNVRHTLHGALDYSLDSIFTDGATVMLTNSKLTAFDFMGNCHVLMADYALDLKLGNPAVDPGYPAADPGVHSPFATGEYLAAYYAAAGGVDALFPAILSLMIAMLHSFALITPDYVGGAPFFAVSNYDFLAMEPDGPWPFALTHAVCFDPEPGPSTTR